jgi:hypothetical protein
MKKLLLCAALSAFGFLNSQTSDKYWSASPEQEIKVTGKRQIVPKKYLTFKLNGIELKNKLFSAPNEKDVKINESTCIITLPVPDGSMQQFRVVEAPMMERGLAEQFPEMKTFSIKGIDDPYANGKLDWTETGFHGNVRSVNGDFFIDPYCVGNVTDYITYYTRDFVKDPSQVIPESSKMNDQENPVQGKKKEDARVNSMPVTSVGDNLRTYRLAIACTGEYAQAATGLPAPTVAQTLAKIVTSINRVNSVYETEVAVRLILVATETLVVFVNPGTDPFTGNNNETILIGESQSVITNTIGTGNFDMGHTFSTGAGGLASLGVVCFNSDKAEGVTGAPSPVGDPYDIDYVAHEMGHQFGGNHTFNSSTGSCGGGNRNGSTAVEPGSGVTIMAYAGICGINDLAGNSIPYFHGISFDELTNFIAGPGNFCAVTLTTGNSAPFVIAPPYYLVPKSTAFVLTGSASDPDGDPLTYSWEEIEIAPTAGNWNSGNPPYFRSYPPVTTPTRYFPKASMVLTGNYTTTIGEYVPGSAQTLQFRLTARDGKMGGGGVSYATSTVEIDNSGPFAVSYPNAGGITWYQSTQETITWDVGQTNLAPINCDSVRISISYNGGNTYTTLIGSTPNDGSQVVSVPTASSPITTCRIKVESKGNIFYDISNSNFTIDNSNGLNKVSLNPSLSFNVWPNPFNDRLNFTAGNLTGSVQTMVRVTDVLGKTILSATYTNKTEMLESIDLSSLSRGMYFISMSNDNRQSVFRIVKD